MSQNLQNFAKFQKFQLDNLVDFEKCCKTRILNYFLAKIGADTAENEQHFVEILPIGRRVADARREESARTCERNKEGSKVHKQVFICLIIIKIEWKFSELGMESMDGYFDIEFCIYLSTKGPGCRFKMI